MSKAEILLAVDLCGTVASWFLMRPVAMRLIKIMGRRLSEMRRMMTEIKEAHAKIRIAIAKLERLRAERPPTPGAVPLDEKAGTPFGFSN